MRKSFATGAASGASNTDAVESRLTAWADEAPDQRTDLLNELLESLRTASLPAKSLFRSLEICRHEAVNLRRELDRSLTDLSLPLPSRKEQFARKCARAYRSLGRCYTQVAAELAGAGGARHTNARYVLESCYWGIASLAEYLLINYARYARIDRGAWIEIHRLYNLARAAGVHMAPLDQNSLPKQSVKHLYKRVLLLGLCDPFQHPPGGLALVYARLDHWSTLAMLTAAAPDPGHCLFAVDDGLDRPAIPVVSAEKFRPRGDEMWLNTRELVEHLTRQHDKSIDQVVRHWRRSDNIAEELNSIDTLRSLIVNWGIHPIRADTRTTTDEVCDIVFGLKRVCGALDKTPTAASDDKVQRRPVPLQKHDIDHMAKQCLIADQSRHGLRIVCSDCKNPGMAVGELLAVRREQSRDWDIGMVHWAQTSEDDSLSIGIQRIAIPAQPVSIHRIREGEEERESSVGLLLTHDSDDGREVSLLCDKSLYFPAAIYAVEMPNGQGEEIFKATHTLLSTPAFVWFEVSEPAAAAAPPKASDPIPLH